MRERDNSTVREGDIADHTRASLQAFARVNEVDRRLFAIRLRRAGIRWIGLPAVGVMTILLLQKVVSTGVATLSNALSFSIALIAGGAGVAQFLRAAGHEIATLEEERRSLASSATFNQHEAQGPS